MATKNFLKFSLIFGILTMVLFFPVFSLALTLSWPTDGAKDIPVTDYFKWQKSEAGASEYGINFHGLGESWVENRVKADDPKFCGGAECSLGFLDLKVGGINFNSLYIWKVIAYDAGGKAIDSSGELRFTTAQPQQAPPPPTGSGSSVGQLQSPILAASLEELFRIITNFLFYLAMGIAPIMIIYAAFLILASGGNAAQVQKGKTIILWTLIAVAIIVFAKGLPSIIKGALGG